MLLTITIEALQKMVGAKKHKQIIYNYNNVLAIDRFHLSGIYLNLLQLFALNMLVVSLLHHAANNLICLLFGA